MSENSHIAHLKLLYARYPACIIPNHLCSNMTLPFSCVNGPTCFFSRPRCQRHYTHQNGAYLLFDRKISFLVFCSSGVETRPGGWLVPWFFYARWKKHPTQKSFCSKFSTNNADWPRGNNTFTCLTSCSILTCYLNVCGYVRCCSHLCSVSICKQRYVIFVTRRRNLLPPAHNTSKLQIKTW